MNNVRCLSFSFLQKIVILASLLATVFYLVWRAGTLNPDAIVFSSLLYAAEIYGFLTVLMHLFVVWKLPVRESLPVPKDLSVDVFVPTINEPVELVRRTLLAAIDMECSHRTFLLDDGRRPEMAELARQLGCEYVTRPDNRDSKAGNLNNALAKSSADTIAIFDADHAPMKDFLVRTLGFFSDPQVAFVQTPQDFYNLDSYQHRIRRKGSEAWHEQSVFFRVIQRGKDYWNASFFCGSCAVIRRSSLDAIGGFATGTVTEDLHTSIRLHEKGFRSVYCPESLAYGLAPATLGSFLLQRIRWGQGAMQVWRKEKVVTSPNLSVAQKINYVASMSTYFDGWQKGFYYLAPALVLITGMSPISSFGKDFFLHFLPYFFLNAWMFEEVSRGYGRGIAIERFNMARFAALASSTLGLFRKKIPFAVTPKVQSAESNKFPRFLFPQLALLVVNSVAIPVGIAVNTFYHQIDWAVVAGNVVWASFNIFLACSALVLSLRKRFRRDNYRFPVPLPARIEFAGCEPLVGTIEDISSSGFCFRGNAQKKLSPGEPLKGVLFLPAGPVEVVGTVKHVSAEKEGATSEPLAIGCDFKSVNQQGQDLLDLLLYGSNLHLAINSYGETVVTPLEKILGFFSGRRPPLSQPQNWTATSIEGLEGASPSLGLFLVKERRPEVTLVTFASYLDGSRLSLQVYSGEEKQDLQGVVVNSSRIAAARQPVYLNAVRLDPQEAA